MEHQEQPEGKLELIATRPFKPYGEMYKVVDFLNKELKHKRLIFGLSKDQNDETLRISIYET